MLIRRYKLERIDVQDVIVKGLQRVLSIKVQSDTLYLWAIVDSDDETASSFRVLIRGTGSEFSVIGQEYWHFMGTHLMAHDCLLYHVWVPLAVMTERKDR